MTDYRVLLYYKYIKLADPAQFALDQRALCQRLQLKGRILVAHEGLNGTVSGTVEACVEYQAIMQRDERFTDMQFKEHDYSENPFAKLKVKVRAEVVTLGVQDEGTLPAQAGQHLTPDQWHALATQPDTVILDARNNYESRIGKFTGAITPNIDNFRDFPQWIDEHAAELTGKTVLMYCTGGIRCEKASALLKQKGLPQVYQLEGGIINYGKHIPAGLWQGSCFVFDPRMAVPVNDPKHHAPISHCEFCPTKTDQYYNCCNVECNKLIVLCADCNIKANGACSADCASKHRLGSTQPWAIAEQQLIELNTQ